MTNETIIEYTIIKLRGLKSNAKSDSVIKRCANFFDGVQNILANPKAEPVKYEELRDEIYRYIASKCGDMRFSDTIASFYNVKQNILEKYIIA